MSQSSKNIEKEFKNLRKNLLDLTLRNQLLNFKNRAKTLRINNQSVSNMFQTLVINHKKMYFSASKKEKEEKSRFSIWDHSPIDFSKFTEGDVKLETDLTPNELQKRLFYINNQAKTMLEEQGYNILYIACGFLEWYDNVKPKQRNLAPLILIPVAIERKTVGKSFNLYWTGEEIQTNISLKAKLKENGIVLPEFEHKNYSEVIEDYIIKVRHAISGMDKWDVNGNIALGFFSFTKLVMYNDLNPDSWEDNVDLTKNELIEAIFNPAKNKQEAFNEQDIDTQLSYENMYQVLDADSSQIAAIQDVKAGRNLVVEGPPGTGKSQTIVNLIAELLAEGKSVLFVAEKMAALDVVKDRLTAVGLGKFVLELHSHKTRRKKFLKELEKATTTRYKEDLKIDQTIRKLETLRRQLDDYAEVIHKPSYAVNLSAFQLYGMKESADDHFSEKGTIIPLVRFSNPESVTLKDLDDIIIKLENLAELYQTISKENPWSKCAPKSLLPADLREIELLISDTLFALDNFLVERERVYDIYGIKKPDTLNEFKKSLSALDLIKTKNMALIDGNVIRTYPGNPHDANKLLLYLEKYQKSSKALDKFNDNIYKVNLTQLLAQVQQLANKKFSFFKNKQNTEIVKQFYLGPVPNINQVIADLTEVREVLKIKKNLDNNKDLAIRYFGEAWHLNANIKDLKEIIRWLDEFNILKSSGMVSQDTIHLLSKDLIEINPEEDLSDYINAGDEFNRCLSRLKSKLNPRSKLIFKKDSGDVPLERWKEQLNNWRGQLSSLHLWSQYLNTKNTCKGSDAEGFIEAIEKRNIKKTDVKALVNGNFADSLLNLIFVENEALVTFIGELHENRITEFKDLDKKILSLNRKRIYQKLNSRIPKIYGATDDPEAKILAGEFTRKSGHLPVRKLLQKAGGTIKQIKPCFMMSPLSIAQYLDPTNEKLQFDVVIFDEASQVKPEDALGAFMRGKTAVVMGDTQQLPPTSFFEQLASGESEEEEATALDMESILHLCKLSFPVKMLKWHYRSRHESLISVSNNQFYDDELLVYPSPSHSDPELGLKFHYSPDTYYERGAGSKNPLEAKEVVKEIFNHFDKYGDTKSLGVGTFSVAQKNAILEELELQRKSRPELEPLFSESREERFFVKNLETIQGDERDVILISVGYGFTSEGKMSLNFGPLNQDGGERRLNVLITRAREKCVVFSNFKSHDMHLTANPPFGVKALYEFLEYAESLTLGTYRPEESLEEPFEDAIASFLIENGYEVDKHIGCAGFRVDLAIKDPENPGKYFLGITTDGKMYSSSKVARDRDRLREQVLTGLGWKLYHLWSTDWYRNRDLARNKLLSYVSKSLYDSREEEKRKSAEEKRLAEKRKAEAIKQAEELRIAREKEEELKKAQEIEEENIIVEDVPTEEFTESCDDIDDKTVEREPVTPSNEFVEVKDEGISEEKSDPVKAEDSTSNFNESDSAGTVKKGILSKIGFDSIKSKFNKDDSDDDLEQELSEITFDSKIESDDISGKKDSSKKIRDTPSKKKAVKSDDNLEENIKFNESSIPEKDNKDTVHKSGEDDADTIHVDYEAHDAIPDVNEDDIEIEDDIDTIYVDHEAHDAIPDVEDDLEEVISSADVISEIMDEEDDLEDDHEIWEDISKKEKEYQDMEKQEVWEDIENYHSKEENKKSGVLNSFINNIKEGESKIAPKLDANGNIVYKTQVMDNETEEANSKGESKEIIIDLEDGKTIIREDTDSGEESLINEENVVSTEGLIINKDKNEDIVFDGNEETNEDMEEHIFKEERIFKVNDKLDNKSAFDEYVVEKDNYYKEVTFKSKINMGEEGSMNPDKRYSKEEIDYYESQKDYYKGASGIKNPLKKNNIHKFNNNENKSVKDTIFGIKDDVKYINKSLKEIENPTPAEYVHVIDRTSDYVPKDENTSDDSQIIIEMEKSRKETKSQEYTKDYLKQEDVLKGKDYIVPEVEFVENNSNEFNKEDYVNIERINDDVIVPEENNEIQAQKQDEILENIIMDADESYKKIEKERFRENNTLKQFDDKKLPKKMDTIVDYIQATDFGIETTKQLYENPLDDVADSIYKIVQIEGPVHVNEVIKRIKDSCEISRAGVKFKDSIITAIDHGEEMGTILKVGDFLFDASNSDVTIRKRVKPNIDLISDEEISKNLEGILLEKSEMNAKDLTKKAARNFGFRSTSRKTASRINSVLDRMIIDGKVSMNKDFVELN